ncbi:MAG: phospholipase D-like domain-containing protein [bacterium]
MRMVRVLLFCFAALLVQFCLPASAGVEAEVRDISGKKYFDAVHLAFRNAEDSIYVAMYDMRIYADRKSGPQFDLVMDLIAAHKRGVKVKVYLDRSESQDQTTGKVEIHDGNALAHDLLQRAGVDVRYVVPTQRLHAKLLVIDERTVVDGSANWSFSALTENAESSTMVISQQYAIIKLQWMWKLKLQKKPDSADDLPHSKTVR